MILLLQVSTRKGTSVFPKILPHSLNNDTSINVCMCAKVLAADIMAEETRMVNLPLQKT